jgi:hypothetical protein
MKKVDLIASVVAFILGVVTITKLLGCIGDSGDCECETVLKYESTPYNITDYTFYGIDDTSDYPFNINEGTAKINERELLITYEHDRVEVRVSYDMIE